MAVKGDSTKNFWLIIYLHIFIRNEAEMYNPPWLYQHTLYHHCWQEIFVYAFLQLEKLLKTQAADFYTQR